MISNQHVSLQLAVQYKAFSRDRQSVYVYVYVYDTQLRARISGVAMRIWHCM